MIELNVNYEDNSEEFKKQIVQNFIKIVYEMHGNARRFCPVDTGRLRTSIHLNKINETTYELRDGVNYGVMVEFGTSPHVIKPVNKKSLHWKSGGKDVFAMSVNHPGTNAQPFFRPALDIAINEINKIFK